MTDHVLGELGRNFVRAVSRLDDTGLMALAMASEEAKRTALEPETGLVFGEILAICGAVQQQRSRIRRLARQDQVNARVPEAGWGPPPDHGDAGGVAP